MSLRRDCAVEGGYAHSGARVPLSPRMRSAGGAEREPGRAVEGVGDGGCPGLGEALRQHGDAERQAVGAEAGRNGDAAQAHEVDEVGVGAETGVEQDRLGLDLGDAVDGGRGGHHEHVCAGQQPPGVALQLGQPVNGAIGVARGPVARRAEDRPGRGVQGVLVAGDHRLDRDVALGEERRLVEQPLRLRRRRRRGSPQRVPPRLSSRAMAASNSRSASPSPKKTRSRALGTAKRKRVGGDWSARSQKRASVLEKRSFGVVARDQPQHVHAVIDGEGEHRDGLERLGRAATDHRRVADETRSRLDADHVVEGRRHAPRTGRIVAERKRHEPGAHRHARAGARPPRHERRIEGVARHAVGRAHADQADGQLVHVGLADDDGARIEQALHGRPGARGNAARGRERVCRGQARHVDVVLDGARQAI